MKNYFGMFIFGMIVIFLFFIIKGAGAMQDETNHLRTNCTLTEYYVIGDKGHVNRIYDCSKDIK